jgi:surface polysaccharide O-acyltransferase-like enzyme
MRALMSVAVVVWHLGGVGDTDLQDPASFLSWRPQLVDLVDLYVCLLAVPLFVLVSAFLFCQRGATTANLWRRVSRLGYLLMFWPLALIVWNESRSGVTDRIPSSVGEAFATLFSAGNTLFYFFVSLILVLAVCRLSAGLHDRWLVVLLTVMTALLGVLGVYAPVVDAPELAKHWSPFNFLPYAFAAVLIARHEATCLRHAGAVVLGGLLLGVALGAWETSALHNTIYFDDMGIALPGYTRPALVPLAIAAFVGAVRYLRTPNPVIHFLSERSLALYCLHMFLLAQMMAAFNAAGLSSSSWRLLHVVSLVLLSYAASLVLERFLNRKLLF